ncbi:MAG: iron-containing alcohol dehydrogenase [Parasporobacterium sp.]|nr:iron-containing alcohol dehydrogenase [Parasporobacterium sp.]
MAKEGENVTFDHFYEKSAGTVYKIYCRIFQAVMKVANYFLGYRMPDYIDGPGSIKKLPDFMREKGAANALIVTDNNILKLGLIDGLKKALEDAGMKYTVFSDIEYNPTDVNVENGYKVYAANGCQCIVAIGGGAPMDCAKAIGAKATKPGRPVAKFQGILKVMHKLPLFFAVPTTSGTGSETTVASVITEAATHHKASINDPHLIPKYAVLDPELTCGLPPQVTATTGMDALCHAVEAYTNNTYNTPLEKKLAKDAVRLIHKSLYKAYLDGSDLEARQDMQFAAFYAGRAFTRGCVGYVHAVGHTLGGLYGVPHGNAMSLILPYVMRQFGPAVYDKLADLADVCGMEGADNHEKAMRFIEWIEKMKVDMNIPAKIDVIKDEDIPQIITWAKKEANPLYPVPVIWGDKELRQLIESIRA